VSDAAESSRSNETDIAFLKRLASAGLGEPAPFLMLMAVFGGAYGLAFAGVSLQVALSANGLRPGDEPGFLTNVLRWSFVAAHLAFLAALVWTAWRTTGPNRVRLSRAAMATWSGAFIGLVTTVVGFRIFTQDQLPSDSISVSYMLPSVLLVLWGTAWWVTGILNDRRSLLLIAFGSFGSAIVMALVGNSPSILPMTAACLLLLAFLPAVLLMRERRH